MTKIVLIGMLKVKLISYFTIHLTNMIGLDNHTVLICVSLDNHPVLICVSLDNHPVLICVSLDNHPVLICVSLDNDPILICVSLDNHPVLICVSESLLQLAINSYCLLLNSFKPGVPFVGHRQTELHQMGRPIWGYSVCLREFHRKME